MKKKCTECEKNKFVLPYEYFANPLTVVEQGGDWIQGAIKNPGRCTPGSPNYDCPKGSPQWNLAQRFKHGDLHKAQGGYQTKKVETKKDSVAHQANKILQYEQLRGGPGGTPLSYYSNPKYMDMLMNNVYPQVQDIMPNANAMESSEAMDFIFNAGRDPRIYMLDQYLKSKGQTGIPNRGSFNIDMNKDPQKWAQKKPELDAIWNQYSSQINSLPANTRRQFLNKGRDWYYQNINNPAPGVPSSDYNDTWYGRIWNTNDYNAFNPKNPKFTPKKEMGGDSQDQIMQLIMMYSKMRNVDPKIIVQKLQQLDENGQQQAIQTMVAEVQQGAGQMQQQQMQEPQQQEAAPMSYADNDESQEMESYADGGAYNYSQTGGRGAQGAAGGFGASGVDYIAPALQTAIGDSKMFAPLKAITGYMGLASGLGASALGYGKSAQWAGNKILPDGKFKTGFNNVMDGANNAFKGIVDFGMSGVTPFNKQMKKYGSAEYGGDLPKAQWGNLANIDMSDPYGLKKPRFGQTANYADTTGYQANANKNNTAATAPAKTMSPGNFNSWDIDNNGIPDTIQKAEGNPLMNNSKTEETGQAPADKNSSFNGMEYAQKGMTGLGTFNSYLDYKANQERRSEYEDMLERVGNTDFRLASNGPNPYGDYTLNVGPSNNFQLGMTTPIQDFGTKGPAAKYGGSMRQSYAEGGEYQVSEDELLQLMQEGAEIEFINK